MGCLLHKWDHCSCLKCGKIRKVNDEDHKFEGCKCAYCGFQRNTNHNWEHGKCSICGLVDEKKGHSNNFKFELDGNNVDMFCEECDEYLATKPYVELYSIFVNELKEATSNGRDTTFIKKALDRLDNLKK